MAYQAAEIEEMLLRCGTLFKRRGFPFSDKFVGRLHEGEDNGSIRRGQYYLKNTNDSIPLQAGLYILFCEVQMQKGHPKAAFYILSNLMYSPLTIF